MLSSSGRVFEYQNNNACGDPECCGANESYLVNKTRQYVILFSTGMKDSKGTEIYDGDVVKFGKNGKGRIIYQEMFCAFLVEYGSGKGWGLGTGKTAPENITVIGNIYEPTKSVSL